MSHGIVHRNLFRNANSEEAVPGDRIVGNIFVVATHQPHYQTIIGLIWQRCTMFSLPTIARSHPCLFHAQDAIGAERRHAGWKLGIRAPFSSAHRKFTR
jgi:hypothetical protein